MEQTELLIGIAQLSIALVGFAGLVAVFVGSKGGVWDPFSRFRLRNLIELGLMVTFVSVMPLILYGLGIPEEHLWRLACGIYLLILFVTMYLSTSRLLKIRENHAGQLSSKTAFTMYMLSLATAAANTAGVINLWPTLNSGFFVTALYFNLGMPAVAFFVMVLAHKSATGDDTA